MNDQERCAGCIDIARALHPFVRIKDQVLLQMDERSAADTGFLTVNFCMTCGKPIEFLKEVQI